MHPIAQELNEIIKAKSPTTYALLSDFGKRIYMPKGIISQGAEAKVRANRYNATIGIAKEKGGPMFLESARKYFNNLPPTQLFEYAPPTGLPALREIWQSKIVNENPALVKADAISMPVVTHALTHGLMLTGDLFVNPGDTILVPEQFWGNYRLMYEVRFGAQIETYPLFDKALTGFNVAALDHALAEIDQEKIVLLLNFPNNPTGYSPTAAEAKAIVQTLIKHAEQGKRLLVISDDAYFGLQYADNLIAGSIFGYLAGAHDNILAVKADGFTKEFYVWGFRVGFLTFGHAAQDADVYRALETKTGACIRSAISNCSRPAQSILLDMMQGEDYRTERQEKFAILRDRALKVKSVVHDPQYADCWQVYPFNSGYFMCLRVKGVSSEAVRQRALAQYGTGIIAIGHSDLRIAFSCVDLDQIDGIFEVLAATIRELCG